MDRRVRDREEEERRTVLHLQPCQPLTTLLPFSSSLYLSASLILHFSTSSVASELLLLHVCSYFFSTLPLFVLSFALL